MAKSSFKYKAPDATKIKEHSEQSGGNFDSILKQGVDMFRPKNGENTIRILPATFKDFNYWGLEIWVHNRIGSDESSYLCPNKMKGKACPICEAADEASRAGEKEEARQLKANKRFLVYLLDRDEKKPMPLVYSMSWSMDKEITLLVQDKKRGKILMIDHPDDGMDVIFNKSGVGLKTKYQGFQIERETSPISDNERRQAEILEFIQDQPLDEILNFYSSEYLGKVLEGKAEKKDELDEDDDDKPKKKRRVEAEDEDDEKPAKRRRAEPEEDDEEDEKPAKRRRAEPEEEEDDEPPKRPRKRDAEDNDEEAEAKTSKRRRAEPEEDDEDEAPKQKKRRAEPDEEDEEPAPKRRRTAEAEEEDDAPPKKKRRVEPEEEDEESAPKKRRRAEPEDDEEDEKPARRVRAK